MPLPKRLKEQGDFTMKDLLARLKQEGFFCNKTSIWKYERMGILPQPRRVKINAWETRVWNQNEIDTIVKILKSLPMKKVLSF